LSNAIAGHMTETSGMPLHLPTIVYHRVVILLQYFHLALPNGCISRSALESEGKALDGWAKKHF
jgi:hypothetical protein